jgi:transcriptional regulator with PAS, ATPase and Fis domain
MQAKLLRVLEDRQVLRVGATTPRAVDVRFIAATNRELVPEVDTGRFRKDIYFRLGGATIEIPPLRERAEEIVPLALHFVERYWDASGGQGPFPELSDAAREQLLSHDWPGNIRELRNVGSATLRPPAPGMDESSLGSTPPASSVRVRVRRARREELVCEGERQEILRALEECSWNQTRAARKLGISRGTLVNRLDAYAIPRPRKGR